MNHLYRGIILISCIGIACVSSLAFSHEKTADEAAYYENHRSPHLRFLDKCEQKLLKKSINDRVVYHLKLFFSEDFSTVQAELLNGLYDGLGILTDDRGLSHNLSREDFFSRFKVGDFTSLDGGEYGRSLHWMSAEGRLANATPVWTMRIHEEGMRIPNYNGVFHIHKNIHVYSDVVLLQHNQNTLSLEITTHLRNNERLNPNLFNILKGTPKYLEQLLEKYKPLWIDARLQFAKNQSESFKTFILDPNRPILVYVSNDMKTNAPLVDVDFLSKLLQYTAIVVTEDSHHFINESSKILPKDFLAWNGNVRVFLPDSGQEEWKRPAEQSMVTKKTLENASTDRARLILIQQKVIESSFALSQRTPGTHNILDFYDFEKKELLAAAKRQLQLLEEMQKVDPFAVLTLKLQRQAQELLLQEMENVEKSTLDAYERQEYLALRLAEIIAELQLYKDENMTLQQALAARNRNEHISITPQSAHLQNELFSHLNALPEDLSEVVQMARHFFKERIFFTEKAFKSAKEASYQNPAAGWKVVVAMAHHLYDLYFLNIESGDKREKFHTLSGLDFAETEKTAILQTPHLRKQRADFYDGHSIEALAHVKYGVGEKTLRAHFWVDRLHQKIVISHFGDHLEFKK